MKNTSFTVEMDEFDRKILAILGRDGRITFTELALQVGLSKTPCQQRVKRLVDSGLIVGFRAIVDPAKVGLDHVAFTEVKLSDTREAALKEFNNAVRRIPEVEECHMIASSFDYLLKVRTPDIRRYRIVLGSHVASSGSRKTVSIIRIIKPTYGRTCTARRPKCTWPIAASV